MNEPCSASGRRRDHDEPTEEPPPCPYSDEATDEEQPPADEPDF